MAEFKKFSETEMIESMSDTASVLVEDKGEIKRIPAEKVGGGSGGKKLIIEFDGGNFASNMTYDEVMSAIKAGEFVGAEFKYIAYNSVPFEYVSATVAPVDIYSYMGGEEPQLGCAWQYYDSGLLEPKFVVETCYLGSWGVSRYPDGANEK